MARALSKSNSRCICNRYVARGGEAANAPLSRKSRFASGSDMSAAGVADAIPSGFHRPRPRVGAADEAGAQPRRRGNGERSDGFGPWIVRFQILPLQRTGGAPASSRSVEPQPQRRAQYSVPALGRILDYSVGAIAIVYQGTHDECSAPGKEPAAFEEPFASPRRHIFRGVPPNAAARFSRKARTPSAKSGDRP